MQVRNNLVGDTVANYSQYTCYTGIADFLPPDIDTVGYRVFLGNGKYFVSSDVGNGKMQWCAPPRAASIVWLRLPCKGLAPPLSPQLRCMAVGWGVQQFRAALGSAGQCTTVQVQLLTALPGRRYGFHKEPAGGKDKEGMQKERLLDIFGHWTDMVTDLIKATPENDVLRRDIFDRPPIFKWTGALARTCAAGLPRMHSSRPLGQGSCPAVQQAPQDMRLARRQAEAGRRAQRAGWRCWATLRTRCSRTWARAAAWPSRTPTSWARTCSSRQTARAAPARLSTRSRS